MNGYGSQNTAQTIYSRSADRNGWKEAFSAAASAETPEKFQHNNVEVFLLMTCITHMNN